MVMKEADIVITVLPQDGYQKRRPVLILSKLPGIYNDFLVCSISSQLQQYIKGFDLLSDTDADFFEDTGLLQSSIIRLGCLAVLPSSQLQGSIGYLRKPQFEILINNLSSHLITSARQSL